MRRLFFKKVKLKKKKKNKEKLEKSKKKKKAKKVVQLPSSKGCFWCIIRRREQSNMNGESMGAWSVSSLVFFLHFNIFAVQNVKKKSILFSKWWWPTCESGIRMLLNEHGISLQPFSLHSPPCLNPLQPSQPNLQSQPSSALSTSHFHQPFHSSQIMMPVFRYFIG